MTSQLNLGFQTAFFRVFKIFVAFEKSVKEVFEKKNDENLVKSDQTNNPPYFLASPNYLSLSNGDLSNRYFVR